MCKESGVCYLQEIDYIQFACLPPCYEQQLEAKTQQPEPKPDDEQPRTDKNP